MTETSGPALPRILREHGGFAAAVLVLLALLGWLTVENGQLDIVLLADVLAVAVLYRWGSTSERLKERARENVVFLVTVVGLLSFLGFLSGWSAAYLLQISITVLIFALFALGLNLEFGYTGIINFGHVAFLGIGAYTTTLLSKSWLPHAQAVSGGGAVSVAADLVVALLVFGCATVLANAGAESILARDGRRPFEERRRLSVWAGAVVGVLAALLALLLVGYPPSPIWAQAIVVAAAMLVGVVLAAACGILLGMPTLRLREDYLAIVTIGAAEILRRIWTNEIWLTGGPRGVISFPLPLDAATTEWAWVTSVVSAFRLTLPYYVILVIMALGALALAFALYEILVRSPYGRVLKAIREDEEVAGALGKNVFVYKLQALALGSAVAAVAGALLAWENVYINPETFLPLFTFYAWIIVVLGGIGNNKGTILGSLTLFTIFEATQFLNLSQALGISLTQEGALRVVVVGVLLVLLMMFKPEGILGNREEMVLGD